MRVEKAECPESLGEKDRLHDGERSTHQIEGTYGPLLHGQKRKT